MSETNAHLVDLQKVRQLLVDQRRQMAKVVANDDFYAIDNLVSLQNQVDAIDRMVADEKKLKGPPTAMVGRMRS